MTDLERAACAAVSAWGEIGCDSRNDAPWSQLRSGDYLSAQMEILAAVISDVAWGDWHEEMDDLAMDDSAMSGGHDPRTRG